MVIFSLPFPVFIILFCVHVLLRGQASSVLCVVSKLVHYKVINVYIIK